MVIGITGDKDGATVMARKIRPRHTFAGYMLAVDISDEKTELAARLRTVLALSDRDRAKEISATLAELEGDVEAACTCGWRGPGEDWTFGWQDASRHSYRHADHVNSAALKRIMEEHSAVVAISTFELAADSWPGDRAFSAWLRERAAHLVRVGVFDGETWPVETPGG